MLETFIDVIQNGTRKCYQRTHLALVSIRIVYKHDGHCIKYHNETALKKKSYNAIKITENGESSWCQLRPHWGHANLWCLQRWQLSVNIKCIRVSPYQWYSWVCSFKISTCHPNVFCWAVQSLKSKCHSDILASLTASVGYFTWIPSTKASWNKQLVM